MGSLERQFHLPPLDYFRVPSMSTSTAKNCPAIVISMNEKWLLSRIQQRGAMLPALVGAERYRLEDLDLIAEEEGRIILTETGQQYLQSL